MQIEANLGYKHAGEGVKLPEYLVRMTHREAMALGANRFEIGEQLNVIDCLGGIENHIHTLNRITNDLNRINKKDAAEKLIEAVLRKEPMNELTRLASLAAWSDDRD
jgi:hypothetical protein